MIAWIIYTLVFIILCFVLYIAFLGINRGIEAKSINKKKNLKKNIKDLTD